MRAPSQIAATLALATLALAGLVPAASAAAPDPAYTVVGELELTEEELALTGMATPAVDGTTLYLQRGYDVLAVDLASGGRRVVGGDPLEGFILDIEVSDGELYVLTRDPAGLHVFDRAGQHVRSLGVGNLASPQQLDIAPDGTVFVVDSRRGGVGNLLRITPDGVATHLLPGACPTEFDPKYLCDGMYAVAADSERVFITDNRLDVLVVYTHAGKHLATFGEPRVRFVTLGTRELGIDDEGLLYLTSVSGDEIGVFEVGSTATEPVVLTRLTALPVTTRSTPRLQSAHARPALTDSGQIILSNASGWRDVRGDVLLLEPELVPWRAPQVLGSAEPGRTLTVDAGRWPTGDGTRGVQWLRDGEAIAGATGPGYRVRVEDVGTRLSLRVSQGYGAHGTATAASAAVPVTRAASTVRVLVEAGATVGRPTRVRVTVSVPAGVVPTGTVELRSGGTRIAGARLRATDAGEAVVELSALAAGTHRISATYSGDDAVLPATAPVVSLTVAKAQSVATFTLRKAKVARSARPVLDVRVTAAGAPQPIGTVQVFDGTKRLKTLSLQAKHRGRLTVRLPALKAGRHKLTVVYGGTGELAGATSRARTLTVAKAKSKVSLKLVRSKVARSAKAKIRVTVKVAGIAGPTGKLRIYDGKKRLRTVTLKAKHRGRLTVTLPRLKAGKHRIKVVYAGSSQTTKKTSAKKTLTVRR